MMNKRIEVENDKENYLTDQEVQSIIDNNNKMLVSFQKKRSDFLNDIIQYTQYLNVQDNELEHDISSNKRHLTTIDLLKKRIDSNKKKVNGYYNEISSEYFKIVKTVDGTGIVKRGNKRRASFSDEVEAGMPFERRGERLRTEVPNSNGLIDESTDNIDQIVAEPEKTLRVDSTEQLAACFESMKRMVEEVQFLRRIVQESNGSITQYISTLEEQLQQSFTCKNCFQKYTVLTNTKNSCSFHPGKTKYYYCKKCEADEFYTCCGCCSKCLPACKNGQHIPLLKYYETKSK